MGEKDTMPLAIEKERWGDIHGKSACIVRIKANTGREMEVGLTDYGARIVSVKTPDRHGTLSEICLGHETLAGYGTSDPHFGCTTGRVANRIANGEFHLDGRVVKLARNENGKHHLHGGKEGFARKLWNILDITETGDAVSVAFRYESPHGEEQYPGTLRSTVVYTVTGNSIEIDYTATTDRPTVVNLTNHAYWNLSGVYETVHDLDLVIAASRFASADDDSIPTGELIPVGGTAFDFRTEKTLRGPLERQAMIDHTFVLDKGSDMGFAARLHSAGTGRELTVETNQPGIHLYTGNSLDGATAWGKPCFRHQALCLEAQKFPDAPHHDNFPSIVLRPGETYRQSTRHIFGTREEKLASQ
jgi:aldose 1-epimerase